MSLTVKIYYIHVTNRPSSNSDLVVRKTVTNLKPTLPLRIRSHFKIVMWSQGVTKSLNRFDLI